MSHHSSFSDAKIIYYIYLDIIVCKHSKDIVRINFLLKKNLENESL